MTLLASVWPVTARGLLRLKKRGTIACGRTENRGRKGKREKNIAATESSELAKEKERTALTDVAARRNEIND